MKSLLNNKRLKKTLRFLTWILAIITILLLLILGYLYLKRDNIRHALLSTINEVQSGELLIDDLDFSVFASFPDLAVVLRNARYYENKSDQHTAQDTAICKLERLSLGINLIDLLSGELRVSKIILENGLINALLYADSSFNFIHALASGKVDSLQTSEGGEGPELHISQITLKNIQLTFTNMINGNRTDLLIKHFYNGLTINNDSLFLNFEPEIEIIGVNNHKLMFLSGTTLDISANMSLNMKTLSGKLFKSRFSVEGANLNVAGSFDLDDDLYLNLEVTSNLSDPSLLLLIFQDRIVRQNLSNIQKGASFIQGRIEGKLLNHVPHMDFSFAISTVEMIVPELSFTIRDFNLQGAFKNGERADMADGFFQITDMSYTGRAGHIQGSLKIENFAEPKFNLKIDGIFDTAGTEKIFRFIETPIYSGNVKVETDLSVDLDRKHGKLIRKSGSLVMKVRDLSFLIRKTGRICEIPDADLHMENEALVLDSLRLKAGESDLFLVSQTNNLLNHLLGFSTDVDLDAKFRSRAFDFNDFFTREDIGQWMLDEFLHDVSGELSFQSTSERLHQESELPPGFVTIRKLRLIPRHVTSIEIISGKMTIDPEKLVIDKFKANIGKNNVVFSGEIDNYDDLFANQYYDNSLITIDLHADDLILKDLFTYKQEIYLPAFWTEHQFRDFDLCASLELPATMDTTRLSPFDLHVNVKKLNAENKRTGLVFHNLSLGVTKKADDLIFENINGKIGYSNFSATSLKLNNITNADSATRYSARVRCDRLNIDEWMAHIFYQDSTINTVQSGGMEKSEPEITEKYQIPPLDIEAEIGLLQYKTNRMHNLKTSISKPSNTYLFLDKQDSTWWLPDINLTATIDSDTFRTDYFKIPETRLSVRTVNGLMEFTSSYTGIFGAKGKSLIQMDVSQKKHSYRINYEIADYRIEVLLERLRQKKFMSGKAAFRMDVVLLEEDLRNLNGEMTISGQDLYVYGVDIDEFLTRYRRTQNFNLVDIGAFMLAGPVGTVITKASDYAILLQLDPEKKSHIPRFLSSWSIESGRIVSRDVAFSTDHSRIAMKGGFDLINSEFIDLTLAVVDEKGCALLSQGIYGNFADPQLTSVNVVGTILGPVTNILKLITGNQCEPFYTGKLPPPVN